MQKTRNLVKFRLNRHTIIFQIDIYLICSKPTIFQIQNLFSRFNNKKKSTSINVDDYSYYYEIKNNTEYMEFKMRYYVKFGIKS